MDFILDLGVRASVHERHPIGGPSGPAIRGIIHNQGIRNTYKVFQLHEPQSSVYIPRFWSRVYEPSVHFSARFNQYYTSENCARKALMASWRQEYFYNHGREHTEPLDDEIELMTVAYRDRSEPPYLVERNGSILTRIPITAYYLGGSFFLVQKL